MTNDPTIREQSYRYFLQEAPELLQALEQDLLTLREDYSINKVHNLMRLTHTLKGAAASIGLETIASVAHSLEDIFKAICKPDLPFDPEVEALLFEGYECLRLPLSAELTRNSYDEGQVNDAEVLDRTATIFAQLQEKLGDFFDSEAHIPSSIELGFDLTQSIFEVGVNQRLEELAAVVANADPVVTASTLRTQAEVFLGLAESLNLSGFGAIARAAIAALDAHPDQAATIAQIALADFQAGQAAVLEGDRSQGGQPSPTLQQLAGLTTSLTEQKEGEENRSLYEQGTGAHTSKGEEDHIFPSPHLLTKAPAFSPSPHLPFSSSLQEESATQPELVGETSAADSDANLLQNEESSNPLLELIWGAETAIDSPSERGDREQAHSISAHSSHPEQASDSLKGSETAPTLVSSDEPEVTLETTLSQPIEVETIPTSIPQKDQVSPSRTVRVNVEHLEYLNYSIGELLTNQNHQSLQNEQLRTAVRSLLARLKQHQQLLSELQDWSDHLFIDAERQQLGQWGMGNRQWGMGQILPNLHYPIPNQFDSLELDRYSESQLLVQSILEDTVQLAEAAEAIELFAIQSTQSLDKQQRLLTNTRDTLMEARMLPLGEIFGRLPRVLQQLEVLHDKPVVLKLSGSEVLVDKLVAEKLYGPLLHLVRNAFAHGIEFSAVRQQRGKPPKGQIEICAYHRGKFLSLEVRDDGQGLDFEAIRRRAVKCQLVSPERATHLNEEQLTNFLFEPGFSTETEVNDLSGRGIGLDMVRAQLQALQGSVEVYSEPQQGATFVLQIPLSLTMAKLLLCQAGDSVYALLADAMDASTSRFAIEQILIPQAHQIRSWDGGKALRWGKGDLDQLIPVHPLSQVLEYFSQFGEPSVSQPKSSFVSQGQIKPIILIRSQDTLLGLEVDQLLGEQELVIRPLGAAIEPPTYVYGGCILADGRLTLVLDGTALIEYVLNKQNNSSTHQSLASSTPRLLSSGQEPRLFPAQIRAALPAAPASAEERGTVHPNLQPRQLNTVLLVDDSITVRQTLALTLEKAGYRVLQAKDGCEALEQLQHQTGIQLVICDIEMPRMNGFEFLKHRQQDPALAEIPVVILTSRSASKHRAIAVELGATDYITKPFLEHKLLATVNDVLEKTIQSSVSR